MRRYFPAFALGIFCLTLTLMDVGNAPAQTAVRLQLHDGSSLRSSLIADMIPFETEFGTLQIPIDKVREIRFGLHLNEDQKRRLNLAISDLKSVSHRHREAAAKSLLAFGNTAIPALRQCENAADKEAKTRAKLLVAALLEENPAVPAPNDVLRTDRCAFEGRVKIEMLTIRSQALGDASVHLGKIDSLMVLQKPQDWAAYLDVDRFPDKDAWTPTGLRIFAGDRLMAKASGSLEMNVNSPGYTASPKGSQWSSGAFTCGALIGRIGQGEPFLLGDSLALTARESGDLSVHIVPGNWYGFVPQGGYALAVKIRP